MQELNLDNKKIQTPSKNWTKNLNGFLTKEDMDMTKKSLHPFIGEFFTEATNNFDFMGKTWFCWLFLLLWRTAVLWRLLICLTSFVSLQYGDHSGHHRQGQWQESPFPSKSFPAVGFTCESLILQCSHFPAAEHSTRPSWGEGGECVLAVSGQSPRIPRLKWCPGRTWAPESCSHHGGQGGARRWVDRENCLPRSHVQPPASN